MLRIRLNRLLPALLFPVVALVQAEPVYHWIDRAGVTHFSETPPVGAVNGFRILELPPPGPEHPVQPDDYYSVANQAARMEARRLESERLRAAQERAAAALRQSEAASATQAPEPVPEPVYPYLYYAYPPYPERTHHHPHRHRQRTGPPPGPDLVHRQPRSGWPNYSFPNTPR